MRDISDVENNLCVTKKFKSSNACIKRFIIEFGCEFLLRVFLALGIHLLSLTTPFIRIVQTEYWPMHNYPFGDEQIKTSFLYWMVFVLYIFLVFTMEVSAYFGYDEEPKIAEPKTTHFQWISWTNYIENFSWRACLRRQLRLFFSMSLSLMASVCVVDYIKVLVGRVRPDFLARCQPAGFIPEKPDFTILGFIPECTQTKISVINSGRKSFPSGHSNISFSTFGFASLFLYYITGKTPMQKLYGWRLVISWLFICPAIFFASTRSADYRHHVEDIVVGSLIGMVFSIMCFTIYYNPLIENNYLFYLTSQNQNKKCLSDSLTTTKFNSEKNDSNSPEATFGDTITVKLANSPAVRNLF